jgi:hypothetical protein
MDLMLGIDPKAEHSRGENSRGENSRLEHSPGTPQRANIPSHG